MFEAVEYLFTPDGIANPYPIYHRIREQAPMCKTPFGAWLITRHEDAIALLENKALDHWGQGDSEFQSLSPTDYALGEALRALGPNSGMPFRTAVIADLSATNKKRAELETIACQIIDKIEDRNKIEVMEALIQPFTFAATCCLLGIDEVKAFTLNKALLPLDGAYLSCMGNDAPHCMALRQQFLSLISEIRGDNGLLSRLAQLFKDRGMDDNQLINMILLLIYASHHNMMSFLGNALLALSSNPEKSNELRKEREITSNSVNELIRYDSPLQYIMLVAKNAVEIHNTLVSPGEVVMIGVGAANRDPSVFENPDTLDFNRPAKKHLAFGHGPFRCIGAQFAEVQASIFLRVFLNRVCCFELAEPLKWRHAPIVQRGLKELHFNLILK